MTETNNHATEETVTAQDFIEKQIQLEKDAREALPYDPSECTFYASPPRQLLFSCLTCSEKNKTPSVICYGCSIQCHSNHEQVELFTKRNMTCDCGTTRMKNFGGCNLRKNFSNIDEPSEDNTYNHNFEGKFCYCDKVYNPDTDIMYQCLLGKCGEDWYHDVCIGAPKKSHPEGVNVFDTLTEVQEDEETLPEDHEFICYKCVEAVPELNKIWDLEGVVKMRIEPQFNCSGASKDEGGAEEKGCNKPAEENKTESEEPVEVAKEEIKDHTEPERTMDDRPTKRQTQGEKPANLFLTSNFRDIVKTNGESDIVHLSFVYPFLADEEQVYEPASDDDAGSSLLEAGTSALHKLPRQQAIDGMAAYNQIKDKLSAFLKPFAEDGKVVTDQDVTGFFEEMKKK